MNEYHGYESKEQMQAGLAKLRAILRRQQCAPCRSGKGKCSVTKENSNAYMERPDGSRTYYCWPGCILLQLDDVNMTKLVEDQFNIEGHYEKLSNG